MRIFFHEKGSQKGQFVPAAAGWCLAHTMVKQVMELHLNFYAPEIYIQTLSLARLEIKTFGLGSRSRDVCY